MIKKNIQKRKIFYKIYFLSAILINPFSWITKGKLSLEIVLKKKTSKMKVLYNFLHILCTFLLCIVYTKGIIFFFFFINININNNKNKNKKITLKL